MKNYIIGISGGTASGKTTIGKNLVEYYGTEDSLIIDQDSYYVNYKNLNYKQREKINYDHPSSIDIDLFYSNLKSLKNGEKIQKPKYDYTSHKRLKKSIIIKPKKFIFVEGILLFHFKRLTRLMFLKIFINTPEKTRLNRRINRDINERGRTKDSVNKQYKNTVLPMHKKFIEPTQYIADLKISGIKNIESSIRKIVKHINHKLSKENTV